MSTNSYEVGIPGRKRSFKASTEVRGFRIARNYVARSQAEADRALQADLDAEGIRE
jgi:hypothetical protein